MMSSRRRTDAGVRPRDYRRFGAAMWRATTPYRRLARTDSSTMHAAHAVPARPWTVGSRERKTDAQQHRRPGSTR